MYTLVELKEKIAEFLDGDEILELLKITPEDLVTAFSDKIEDRFDALVVELFGEEEEEE